LEGLHLAPLSWGGKVSKREFDFVVVAISIRLRAADERIGYPTIIGISHTNQ
jgi:hypothetical protein